MPGILFGSVDLKIAFVHYSLGEGKVKKEPQEKVPKPSEIEAEKKKIREVCFRIQMLLN